MKIVIAKSKEYKKFTDLFYKHKDVNNYKELLSTVYNSAVFQSGYLDLPDSYIQDIPEIFEVNADLVIEKTLLAPTSPSVTSRDKIFEILKNRRFVFNKNAYLAVSANPETIYGLGYFDHNTQLKESVISVEDIEPVQIISPAPIICDYKYEKSLTELGEGYKRIVNGPDSAIRIDNNSSQAFVPSSSYYAESITNLEQGYGVEFVYIKNTKLGEVDVSNLNMKDKTTSADRIKNIDIYKVDGLRPATIEKNLSYYLVKDKINGEVFERITKNGEEYLGPKVTVTESVYTNAKYADMALAYSVKVEIGAEEATIPQITEDIEILDAVKEKVLAARKKYGELTFDDASNSISPMKITGSTRETQPFFGFSASTHETLATGEVKYNIDAVQTEINNYLTTNTKIIIGGVLYNILGISEIKTFPVNKLNVATTMSDGKLVIYKYDTTQQNAGLLFINKITPTPSSLKNEISLVLAINNEIAYEIRVTPESDISTTHGNDLMSLLEAQKLDKILEIELNNVSTAVEPKASEYHRCSSINLHSKLDIKSTDGSTIVSTEIPVKTVEADSSQFYNDGKVTVEPIELDKV